MKSCIMEHEAREAPKVVAAQLTANALIAQQLGEKIRSFAPQFVMIIGRGSPDHAGVFGKYLIEIEVGLPTFSAAPSVTSVYGKQLKLDKALVIIISQSGTSPDILTQASMAKAADLIHLHQTTIDIHPRIAPIALLLRFYIDVVAVAKVRGIDPDSPVGLTKMTETL